MKKKNCECKICQRGRQWERLLKKYTFTKKDKQFLDKIYMDLYMTELNYEVDEAIMDGSWPSAIEQLGRAMEKAQDIKKRRENGERI